MTEEESISWNIDLLGPPLGLSSDTIKKIKMSSSTDEDRLRECLFYWLKSDGVNETEGPKCDDLKEALKSIGIKEEIIKKIDEKFPQTKGMIIIHYTYYIIDCRY